ncbi:hypothetical protein ACRAWF_39680 [Streptomyces sp. L7]
MRETDVDHTAFEVRVLVPVGLVDGLLGDQEGVEREHRLTVVGSGPEPPPELGAEPLPDSVLFARCVEGQVVELQEAVPKMGP